MRHQIPLDPSDEVGTEQADGTLEVATDLAYQRLLIVNVVFYGDPSGNGGPWVLIDAGLTGTSHLILSAAQKRFGEGNPPAAIILTHGHFDHIGGLFELAEHWNVPIYAHDLELPYLDGRSSYPAPDPTVGGGLMSALSSFYPRGPINVRRWLKSLPDDRTVPEMPGFRWIATPGHSPGHVSFYRETDRTLIAGDALITTNQESVYAVLTQSPELHGPPMYYTPDWESARCSLQKLAALSPALIIPGHGPAMRGPEVVDALQELACHFESIAVPDQGHYVDGSWPVAVSMN
jgi:glyoxylase-like metal-dependent hydrolase (beta-lactamase superfamily II)